MIDTTTPGFGCLLTWCAFAWLMLLPLAAAAGVASPGWKPHLIRQGDGKGGWTLKEAQYQILRYRVKGWTGGYGVAQMDNGEIVVVGTCDPGQSLWYGGGKGELTLIAFSRDRGDTWTQLEPIAGVTGRPMMLAYLGSGRLTFVTGNKRYFSADYGRTWPQSIPMPAANDGTVWVNEGNPLVDRDDQGNVVRMAECLLNPNPTAVKHIVANDFVIKLEPHALIRWSDDGGRTWRDEVKPQGWSWQDTYKGEPITRWVSEASVIRADNGWLVAALRTDMPARFVETPNSDQMCGTGTSISKDDGRTWSPMQVLFPAGRMHAHLVKTPKGDLVMTVTVRHDMEDGKLATYRRGCEAIVSRDHGLTWDLEHKAVLDEWQFYDRFSPVVGQTGHLYATVLDDGSILTVHNNYLTMGMSLIRWRP